jgi:hypothetical protein
VRGSRQQTAALISCLIALAWLTAQSQCRAQVAFVPIVGFIPTGSTMTVTPVVTPDRRYVRLSVSAFFNDLNGFTPLSVPAAVGGQFGGGFGGFAGMNGIIEPAGGGGATSAAFGVRGEPLAGPVPPPPGLIAGGDPLARAGEPSGGLGENRDAIADENPGDRLAGLTGQDTEPALAADISTPAIRSARKPPSGHRRTARSKVARRRGTTLQRQSP